ncbi:hypothetical protein [Halostagnicola kamekurae]|uniref:hypothetical protein n=1 Tax=Halostagnicola kamekurae TaxID=619731 RepID=UPI001FE80BD7|nr:hypothetical protein [Halostagnicola kamekurae]
MTDERASRPETGSGADADIERVSTEEIVDVIRAAPVPVVNTQYLADECDISVDALFEQLFERVEDGILEHHSVEDRWHLWWLTLETELEESTRTDG